MPLFPWLAGRAPASAPPEVKTSVARRLAALTTAGRPQWTSRDLGSLASEGFAKNPVVYRCVRMIAEAAASIPLYAVRDGARAADDDPLARLLARPNPEEGGADLMERFFGSLQTAGNAYLEAAGEEGAIGELYVLRPDRVKVVPGADGWPAAWTYSAGGREAMLVREADGWPTGARATAAWTRRRASAGRTIRPTSPPTSRGARISTGSTPPPPIARRRCARRSRTAPMANRGCIAPRTSRRGGRTLTTTGRAASAAAPRQGGSRSPSRSGWWSSAARRWIGAPTARTCSSIPRAPRAGCRPSPPASATTWGSAGRWRRCWRISPTRAPVPARTPSRPSTAARWFRRWTPGAGTRDPIPTFPRARTCGRTAGTGCWATG